MPSADDITKKREALLGAYDGLKWADKVKRMTDQQIVAIYLRLKAQNQLKL